MQPEDPLEYQLRALVSYAVRAPSSYNSQPWRFTISASGLGIRADRSRLLPVSDPTGREMTMACGAAAEFAVVAARHFGRDAGVDLFPDPADPDLLARLRLGAPRQPHPVDEALFAGIGTRRSCRRPFGDRPIPFSLHDRLNGAAYHAGARLEWLAGADRSEFIELVQAGELAQLADPSYRRELGLWLRPSGAEQPDGVPGLGVERIRRTSEAPESYRPIQLEDGTPVEDSNLARHSAGLVVLETIRDEPREWFRAGRAVARVLLIAASEGVQTSFLSRAIQVDSLRSRLRFRLGSWWPQVAVRLGYGPQVSATPRRAASEVTLMEAKRLWPAGTGWNRAESAS